MDAMDVNRKIFFNGINANGQYLVAPVSVAELAALALGQTLERKENDKAALSDLMARKNSSAAHFGLAAGLDAEDLGQTGWGVILPAVKPGSKEAAEQAQILDALKPLLDWRREQATKKNERFYQEFRNERGYRPGESKQQFLARLGAAPGPADPNNGIPYYLLIVGSPEDIPYHIQYQIDVQYAVGRIHFDTILEYANYARSVVAAETGGLGLDKEIAFFGTANSDDLATQLSRKLLVEPLADTLEQELTSEWKIRRYYDENANRASLEQILKGGVSTPALLFTASHGVGFDSGDPRQQRHQGALICQDWPGPLTWQKPIEEGFYFSADHLSSDANLLGTITFNFACYSGGTPQLDEFAKQAFKDRVAVAPAAFVSGLHKKMLGLERGGALACIGHVERAWGCSFLWDTGRRGTKQPQLAAFSSTLRSLLQGKPVGAALEYFNQRYAELSSDLVHELEESEWGTAADPYELANMWTSNNDARGYAITGDPAVRLRRSSEGGVKKRSEVEVESFGSGGGTTAGASATVSAAPAESPVDRKVPAPTSASVTYDFLSTDRGGNEKTKPGIFQQIVDQALGTLSSAVRDLSRLEVRTYSSSDIAATALKGRDALAQAAELRAYTCIMIDGDIDTVVPEQDGTVDTPLWSLHLEFVKQAQAHRAEMIKTLLALVKGT